MKTVTQQLADFAAETKYEDLPDKVVHEAKRVVLDSMGCALAGMATNKGKIAAELAKRLAGPPESSIIGTTQTVSCTNAAFANGELINALDFDAGLRPTIHVSPFVLPPAIALGESRSASGKELILAAVLGHELTSRVASGLSGMGGFSLKGSEGRLAPERAVYGYSANGFGSVASAGKILKLDPGKMANAFGIAGYDVPMQTSTHWQHSGTDSLLKYASPGWIAQMGTTAALLAEMGYTGDLNVLDGEYSFWRFSGSDEWRPEVVVRNLGREWHILNMRYKRYPCCGIITAPLHLFTSMIDRNSLMPGEIEQVKVWLSPLAELPLWQNREIDTEVQAQFSVAYVFALAACGVTRGAEWQNPANMKSPKIRDFMGKVSTAAHPEYEKTKLEIPIATRVDIVARGRTYSEDRSPSGSIPTGESRVADSDLVEKFRHNASGVLSALQTEEVVKSIWGLEEVQSVTSLTKSLAGRPG